MKPYRMSKRSLGSRFTRLGLLMNDARLTNRERSLLAEVQIDMIALVRMWPDVVRMRRAEWKRRKAQHKRAHR